MAKCGNHGFIIPRDRELLARLYWDNGLSFPKIAAMYGVTHGSVRKVFKEYGIPSRPLGPGPPPPLCVDCRVAPTKRLAHKLTKNGTGTRCHECLKKYKRASLVRCAARNPDEYRARRRTQFIYWYVNGAKSPKGERQWITKSLALLRTAKRLIQPTHAASSRLIAAYVQEETSLPSCRT